MIDIAVNLGCDPVNLHAITSGDQHGFGKIASQFHPAAIATQFGSMDRQFFAQFNRRGFVTQACDKDAHATSFPSESHGLRVEFRAVFRPIEGRFRNSA